MGMVEMDKEKRKKSILSKTLSRCRYFGGHQKGQKRWVAPEGCFSVYVGPGKERFVVRTEWVTHPLFRALLDEAEMEYGYAKEGPLELPCDVEIFHKVMGEMGEEAVGSLVCNFGRTLRFVRSPGCNFIAGGHAGYQLLSHRPERW